MKKNLFSDLPWIDMMQKRMNGASVPAFREVNAHLHTPYSFSAFDRLETIFQMAKEEEVTVLGINDFFVTDGYEDFSMGCLRNNIFPLFNIEFIGLLKNEQKKGIRINDPNNPGRIYFTGKGLDYPFDPGFTSRARLNRVISGSQEQMKSMIGKLNSIISNINPSLALSYKNVREQYAKELVRERHLARAVRLLAMENYNDPESQIGFIEALYGNKKSKAGVSESAALENEIRSNLLKAGGAAFIEEDVSTFLELSKLIKIIHSAGGIPCYPVLLDDPSGRYTEFEADKEALFNSLTKLGVGCIELIPGRNDINALTSFVKFFDSKGFVVLFGTEHNTPEMLPLTVTARGGAALSDELKQISWNGACVVAAHQYLRAHRRQGYVLSDGTLSNEQKHDLTRLGKMVIEYYLIRQQHEQGN